MKWIVFEIAKRLAVAVLVFAVLACAFAAGFRLGYQSGKDSTLRAVKALLLTPGAWHTASAQEVAQEVAP